MAQNLEWTHYPAGSAGPEAEIAASLASAQIQAFTSVDDWRLFQIGVLAAASELGPRPPTADRVGDETATLITVARSPRDDSARWQAALIAGLTALILGPRGAPGSVDPSDLAFQGGAVMVTKGGGPARVRAAAFTPGEAGFAISGTVALVIICAGLIAGGLVYANNAQNAEVRMRQIEADQKTTALKLQLAQAAQVADKHYARERQSGTTLPYDRAELQILETLQNGIRDVTNWTPQPPVSIPNLAGVSRAASGAIRDVGKGAGTGVMVALAIAAYLAFN